ncbi:hypothetical protein CH380_12995 [Leptospira adleri]|uniref:Uncharacterized protein n=1 Tax=Leptospira adleri TaxID=2023186 RepID=A0A2M9YN61_9LEPT|nr:hypothetical protein CH380_12995 [Leptospira adleri]PJZ61335.1 hypothetical protein CH376_13605 [Leptospira adleri]
MKNFHLLLPFIPTNIERIESSFLPKNNFSKETWNRDLFVIFALATRARRAEANQSPLKFCQTIHRMNV